VLLPLLFSGESWWASKDAIMSTTVERQGRQSSEKCTEKHVQNISLFHSSSQVKKRGLIALLPGCDASPLANHKQTEMLLQNRTKKT